MGPNPALFEIYSLTDLKARGNAGISQSNDFILKFRYEAVVLQLFFFLNVKKI